MCSDTHGSACPGKTPRSIPLRRFAPQRLWRQPCKLACTLGRPIGLTCLIAAITCGEAKLRQNRNAADLQLQAAAVQKLYDELAALYAARVKQALCSPVMSAEPELAARCFALECARHVNRDEESARHAAAAGTELLKNAGENP